MWHNVGFGETRLSTNQFVMKKWQDLILREGSGRTFLMAGSLNNCEPPDDVDDVPSTPQEESLKLSMDKSLLGGHAKGGALLLASFFVLIFVFVRKRHNRHIISLDQEEKVHSKYGTIDGTNCDSL